MSRSLLISFFLLGIVSSTIFHANGTLFCGLEKEWCYHITFLEQDFSLTNDKIDFVGTICSDAKSIFYKLEGHEDGDGLDNDFYELTLFITHSCTDQGPKIRQLERVTQSVPINASSVHITWNLNIANTGEYVKAYVP